MGTGIIIHLNSIPSRVTESWTKKDEYVTFSSYRTVHLDKVQSMIWELCDGNNSIEMICKAIHAYDVQDIKGFIIKCCTLGYIEIIDDKEWDI